MGSFIVRRLLQMIPVVLLVTIGVFLLLHLTGDPINLLMGNGEALDPEQVALLKQEYGLDHPLINQYFMWLGRTVTGDLGRSNKTQRPVIDELKDRLPVTLELGLFAWLFSIIIAIPAGIVSAVKRGSWLDVSATIITIGGLAVPGFWLGTMLILLFAVQLRWLPPFGFVSVFSNPIEGIKSLALPVISLGVSAAALNMRQIRSSMLEVLVQDYIRTARAKGLRERSVIWVHALKNAGLPVITLMGMQIGRLAGGAVVIENVFAIPGMGRLMVTSILASDFPVVQACVLIIALAVLFSNLITDIIYGYLDPRIRLS